MIENFKTDCINAPFSKKFESKRIVIFEKFIPYDTVEGKIIHLRNTILKPGEYVWFIDRNNLNIERYTISVVSSIRVTDTSSTIWFYNKNGDDRGVQIRTEHYLNRLDTLTPCYIYGAQRGGERFMCSSEENVLITLKHYIPVLTKLIQTNLNFKNTSKDKIAGKKSQLKKLQKFHKQLVEYFKKSSY